eukprot:TRINITY_DN4169_c0_g1_i1.p1 TRINITY_DN4169_c0_g1~~TRINITY_DN4169_c0_g1_i1.p1  ORF type:complete len:187 (+),score=58.33 TRINITY_DN4169_c0_g1_i1:420-980(+)
MMRSLQDQFPERRDMLLKLLGVSLSWSWSKLSDGQRRRVQLFLGLLYPFQVLLLDEVAALLDVVCRHDLFSFLKTECVTRSCTVIVVSHVFDGLSDDWVTHCLFLHAGAVSRYGLLRDLKPASESIYEFVLRLLIAERDDGESAEDGEVAHTERDPLQRPEYCAGGYSNGRSSMPNFSARALNFSG